MGGARGNVVGMTKVCYVYEWKSHHETHHWVQVAHANQSVLLKQAITDFKPEIMAVCGYQDSKK